MQLKEITIELTQRCPNCCLYCSSMSNPSKETILSVEQIEQVIDDAVALGAKSISLSGGEPFMHPNIKEIIDYIYSKGISCLVYSSGIIMTNKNEPSSVPLELLQVIKHKVSKLIVNVEAEEEKTYNTIMGTAFGGFSLMQMTIRKAIALGIIVEAHMVPMKVNYLQIPGVVKLCVDLGISQISFLRLVIQGRAQNNLQKIMLGKEEYETAMCLMKEASEYSNIKIRLGIPFREGIKHINCMTGICKLDVRYDGKVYPCEAFKNDNLTHMFTSYADNIREKSLIDIYHSSTYLKQVRELLDKFQRENTCETCMNQYYSTNEYR